MTVDSQHRATGGPRPRPIPTPDDVASAASSPARDRARPGAEPHRPGDGGQQTPDDGSQQIPDEGGQDTPDDGSQDNPAATGEEPGESSRADDERTDDLAPERDEEVGNGGPSDRPSGVQVAASALAAVTATALLSTLGVAGTIIGAALSSVVTVFANYLYSNSLRRTAERVAAAPPVRKVRARTHTGTTAILTVPADGGATDARQGSTLALATATAVTDSTVPAADRTEPGATDGRLDRLRTGWRSVVDRYGYRKIVVTALAFFAAVLAAVTLIELAAGKPLADVVRNKEGAGTSLFGGGSAAVESETTDPASGTEPGNGTNPGTGAGTEEDTEAEVTDPELTVPGEEQPAESDESVPDGAPTSEATPETDGSTPSPSPSSDEAPVTPEQSPSPGDQAPADQAPTGSGPAQPTPEVQPRSVPEAVPAE